MRSPKALLAIAFLVLVWLVVVVGSFELRVLMLLGVAITVYTAYFFPLITVLALLITAVLPVVYQMTPGFNPDYGVIGGGLNAVDIVLVSMAAAVGIRVLKRGKPAAWEPFSLFGVLFAVWLLFEIVRNVGTYGISAPGEFRYRYLVLVVPVYIAFFFEAARERRKLFWLLVFCSVVFTLASVPIIGTLKAWLVRISATHENRFLPSEITLGLVYGLAILFLARKYRFIGVSNGSLWFTALPVIFMVYIDSHRSVWLACSVIIFALTVMREIKVTKIWQWAIPLLILVVSIWFTSEEAGLNPTQYIAARGIAFVSPEEDQTSAWRLAQWEIQISQFYSSPVVGEGFGGHFGVSGIKGDVGIQPHNFYVQTLVKLGVIGMFLYLAVVFKLLSAFKRWARNKANAGDPEIGLVKAAFVILIAAHAFYFAYPLEYYTWLYVGLGIAIVRNSPASSQNGS
jgi:O-antigen ligase